MQPDLPSISVIVPMRNEAGTVRQLFSRLPVMGSRTEVIVAEGGSTDDTWQVLQRTVPEFAHTFTIRTVQQTGRGKADAVMCALKEVTGDIVMILDADLSVDPEALPHFLKALTGATGFVNGSRFMRPMEPGAMQRLNYIANRMFALILSMLIGQRITDALCGTKVLRTADFRSIISKRKPGIDPFGDFDLLFGAAHLGLRIAECPVEYRRRVYGQTNIRRFRDGLKLLGIVIREALVHRQ